MCRNGNEVQEQFTPSVNSTAALDELLALMSPSSNLTTEQDVGDPE